VENEGNFNFLQNSLEDHSLKVDYNRKNQVHSLKQGSMKLKLDTRIWEAFIDPLKTSS
jgi:hypothetical protein